MGKTKRSRQNSGGTTPPKNTQDKRQRTLSACFEPLSSITEKDTTQTDEMNKIDDKSEGEKQTDMEATLLVILEKVSCLPQILSEIKEVKKDIETLKETVKFNSDEVQDLKIENNELKERINKLEKKDKSEHCLKLETEINLLKKDIVNLETYSRKENIIIHGIKESSGTEDCKQLVKNLINNKLQISGEINIQRCHRLGKKQQEMDRHRPIIARFAFFSDRETVWKKKQMLKGSNLFIEEDLPVAIQQRRRRLLPVMKAARRDGKRASVHGDRLMIEGKPYTVESINSLPEKWTQ